MFDDGNFVVDQSSFTGVARLKRNFSHTKCRVKEGVGGGCPLYRWGSPSENCENELVKLLFLVWPWQHCPCIWYGICVPFNRKNTGFARTKTLCLCLEFLYLINVLQESLEHWKQKRDCSKFCAKHRHKLKHLSYWNYDLFCIDSWIIGLPNVIFQYSK